MDISFVNSDTSDFDARLYISILIAIAKADPDNGLPEYQFVRRQARLLDLDYDHYLSAIDKSFSIDRQKASRTTALAIIKDAIVLASLDGNFSLPEKQRVYTYAEKLDISRRDVDSLETLIENGRALDRRWQQLVNNR